MCKYLDSRSRSASIQRYALKSFVGSDGPFHQFLKRKNFVGSEDSNHRRQEPADLQSAPFGHSGNYPLLESECKSNNLS